MELGAQPRPFSLGFLHPVFAKAAMARIDQWADRCSVMCFGYCNQPDVFAASARKPCRALDVSGNLVQSCLCVFCHSVAIGIEMPKRHSRPQTPALPRLWLMTDERLGENLFPTLRKLPKGAGVIFRHYSLTRAERAGLFRRVRAIARARRLMLLSGAARKPRRTKTVCRAHGIGRGTCAISAFHCENRRDISGFQPPAGGWHGIC